MHYTTQNDSQFLRWSQLYERRCCQHTQCSHVVVRKSIQSCIVERVMQDYLLEPYLLSKRLNCTNYLVFLQHVLRHLMQGIRATESHNKWFMHDAAIAHFAFSVRYHLDATHPGRWIGRGGPVAWLPRSKELGCWISSSEATLNLLFIRRLCIHWRNPHHGSSLLQQKSPA